MALLGLRSLYFALAGSVTRLHYLRISLGAVSGAHRDRVSAEGFASGWATHVFFTLGAVMIILAGGIIASLLWGRQAPDQEVSARRE
jgi:tellurite resistance protein TerC